MYNPCLTVNNTYFNRNNNIVNKIYKKNKFFEKFFTHIKTFEVLPKSGNTEL